MEETFTPAAPASTVARDEPPAAWRDLREWIALAEQRGQLHRIAVEVDPIEELAAITYMRTRDEKAPALLFETFRDNPFGARVLSNMLGNSRERYALTLGLDPEMSIEALVDATRKLMKTRIPPVMIAPEQAPVNEIILTGDDIDLGKLPVPRFWPGDGGLYIGTGDITLTQDPATGRINVGCYRQMLHGRNRVGLYCSPGKDGRLDREAWWAQNKPCEVVAAYGVDPALFMASSIVYGRNESELDAAGALTGRPVELTRGVTGSLPIPARAEIVIEGVLHPGDLQEEGPLGEFTGYYGSPRSTQPVIEVKALHMRRNPILTAALMARYPSCEQGTYYAIARSARILDDLDRVGLPGVRGVYAHPAAASGFGMIVISLTQKYAGHVAQALALCAQAPAAAYYTKWIIAVDDDVDPTDMNDVMWALSTRCNPADDLDILRKTWSTGLDPSQFPPEKRPYGSKVLIDACRPHAHLQQFPKSTLLRRSVRDKVAARWRELGFEGVAPEIGKVEEG